MPQNAVARWWRTTSQNEWVGWVEVGSSLGSAGSEVIGSRSIPGGSALNRWPNREDGRKDSVKTSSASCMSRAGMDRSRDMNFANLVRKGVRACDCESWVMMGIPARMICVVVIDVPIGNRCIRVWMLHLCAGGSGRCRRCVFPVASSHRKTSRRMVSSS